MQRKGERVDSRNIGGGKQRKRNHETINLEDNSTGDEFELDGLLNDEESDEESDKDESQDEKDGREIKEDNEKRQGNTDIDVSKEKSGVENKKPKSEFASTNEEDESDSDAEFNELLAEEDDSVELEDFSDEPHEESHSVSDRLSNVRIKSSDNYEEGEAITKYADGRPRIMKPEIDPVYDSDDSDNENVNTIGNVPISAYDEMPHIGYDINGKRIMRPAKGSSLDQLLESIELPEGWTGLLDQNTGSALKLNEEELDLIRKIQANENTDENINPFEPMVDWFSSKQEVAPISAAPEPKRRFVPSKHEAKRVMKIVKAIRDGRIVPPHKVKEQREEEQQNFDLWEDNQTDSADHIMNLRAPKLPPPTNEESYNPPEEYLMTEEEKQQWENTEPQDRDKNFIPQKYGSLRKVPGYPESVRERFERALDLYLAPRVRHNKLNIDPDSLIPELPSPKDLRPFPIRCSNVYEGHTAKIRALSVSHDGLWLATGSDDGSVRIWEVISGREIYKAQLLESNSDDNVESLEWHPDNACGILAVAAGEQIFLIVPPIFGFDVENEGRSRIESGWGFDTFGNKSKLKNESMQVNSDDEEEASTASGKATDAQEVAKWETPKDIQTQMGVAAVIRCRKTVKKISWHRKGDYFVTVSPDGGLAAIVIHQISKHLSRSPFRKSRGIIMDAKFHPSKPILFIASQRYIRIYDLAQQTLIKKLMPGARWLSGIDIHPRGDNLLASSYDKRVLWHDLELAPTPYKTLRYHEKAVRATKFHKSNLPLFATASDDCNIHVFHGTVYDDLMTNPLLVPLKKLTGHKQINSLGVLDIVWHPKEAWLFSAGADCTARLWTT